MLPIPSDIFIKVAIPISVLYAVLSFLITFRGFYLDKELTDLTFTRKERFLGRLFCLLNIICITLSIVSMNNISDSADEKDMSSEILACLIKEYYQRMIQLKCAADIYSVSFIFVCLFTKDVVMYRFYSFVPYWIQNFTFMLTGPFNVANTGFGTVTIFFAICFLLTFYLSIDIPQMFFSKRPSKVTYLMPTEINYGISSE